MTRTRISRRQFLTTATIAASTPFILPSFVFGADTRPNARITLGVIGTGKMGRALMNNFLRKGDVQVVAVCDVDATRREHHQKLVNDHYARESGKADYNGCDAYEDFRELLAREDIDGVVIATPDHWHAIIAIAAARAGKDIYCEKPLCQSVNEARALVEAVRKHERVFQTGSQQRSTEHFRRACEWIRNGRIGELQRVNVSLPPGIGVWCDLPESSPPEGLNWDFWLGPAPERGWNEILSPVGVHDHYPRWRHYREYGGGMVTDWGAHHFDIAQWALGADDSGPVEVIPPPDPGATFGARLLYRSGVEVTHLEGNGITFFGTEGKLFVNRATMEVAPEAKGTEALPSDALRLYQSDDHSRNWLDCIRSRERPICDVEIGARSVTVCHLANMAYWRRERFSWDPDRNRFFGGTGDEEWLGVSYRAPWNLGEA